MSMPLAIECEGVTKHYPHFQLQDVNLSFEQGTVMGLVGPNGAGKSTILRIIMGLIGPDSGRVKVLGHSMPKDQLAAKRNIGFVAEDMRLYESENIAFHMAKGNAPLDKVLNTGKFNFEKAQQAPGWLKELRGEHTPETEEYGISSFVYRARKPFHPQKLHDFFADPFLKDEEGNGKLLRSKGFFWLASRPQYAGQWSQAGGIAQHGAAGMFWKAVPKERWPDDKEQVEYIMEKWVEPFGDMRQELVFIGRNMNQSAFIAELDACLLTDEEMLKGQEYWKSLADPFPSWYSEEA